MSQHDMVLDNGPGLAVRTDMNAAIQALASTNSGPTEPATPYAGQFWLDTTVAPNGTVRMRNQANTAWIRLFDVVDTAGIDKLVSTPADMSVLFRTAPNRFVINDKPDGSGKDVFVVNENGGIAAKARNRLVNGAMQHSQEQGNAAASTTGVWPADQWQVQFAAPGAAVTFARNGPGSPNGSRTTLTALYVVTPKASLAATDNYQVTQTIEGNRVADFLWGAAVARQAILRFWVQGAVGTFNVRIRNSAADRSFLAPFTITTANVWQKVEIVIPGDTTGTWLADTGIGMAVDFNFAAGSSFTGVAGWQAGNKIGLAGMTNGLAVASTQAWCLADVGLYIDDQNTGAAPPWEQPDYADELAACQRYWQKLGAVVDTATGFQSWAFSVELRTSPVITGGGPGFVGSNTDNRSCIVYQTTRNINVLVFNARM